MVSCKQQKALKLNIVLVAMTNSDSKLIECAIVNILLAMVITIAWLSSVLHAVKNINNAKRRCNWVFAIIVFPIVAIPLYWIRRKSITDEIDPTP